MKKFKKAYITFLRLVIAFGIIAYLVYKVDLHTFYTIVCESLSRWPWMISGVMLCFLCLCIGIVRWKIILDTQELKMSWTKVFSIHFIGQFFNSFMFGTTGGDFVRAFYAAKETHHKKTEAVTTVIIDRAIGFIALCLITGIMLVVKARFYISHWETHIPAIIILVMIGVVIIGLIMAANINRVRKWSLFNRIRNHPIFGPQIKRVINSFQLYHQQTSALVITLILSVAAHILLVFECYCLGRSFQINLSFFEYLMLMPLVMTIAAIPITPGGLGIREGLAVTMLGVVNVSNTKSLPLSLMLYFIALAWSLIGGIVFVYYSTRSGHTVHEEIIELKQEASSENRDVMVAGSHE